MVFLLGIIIISVFLFPQPTKAETEIIGVYPLEDNYMSPQWDSDGLLTSDGYQANNGNWYLMVGNSFHPSGSISSKMITYLKFDIPNSTKEIKSMKLRMYYNYVSNTSFDRPMPVKTELVNNNWSEENLTWVNKPDSLGISTITEWDYPKGSSFEYVDLTSLTEHIENNTFSIKIESLLDIFFYVGFWQIEIQSDIERFPILIIEYKEEPPEPIPPNLFTLTSDADTPDTDGLFTLYWINSENADNYSVYKDDVLLNSGLIYTQYYVEISSNGNYNFSVMAFNEYGNTSSNEITVNIEIPPPPPPNPFVLTSDANNPDMDGIFTLSWTASTRANSYSVYQKDILMDNGLTTLYYDVGIYTDGSYDFKIIAFNEYGNISSNEITVNIDIPLPPPNPFTLTSDADTPDTDGNIMLYWSSSAYTDVYSVYFDDVLLEWGITNLYYNVKIYADGSYNFKVIALNDYGQTTSNEITVNVEMPIVQPEPPEPIERDIIPFIVGFSVGIGVLGVIVVVGVVYRIKAKKLN